MRRGLLILLLLVSSLVPALAQNNPVPFVNQPRVPSVRNFAIPPTFEPNVGQSESRAQFISRGRGYTLFLTGNGIVLSLPGSRESGIGTRDSGIRKQSGKWKVESEKGPGGKGLLHSPFTIQNSSFPQHLAPITQPPAPETVSLKLVGPNPHPKIIGLEKLPGISNYFIGNDAKKWRTKVPNYARVMVKDVYPGIDMVFYGKSSVVSGQLSVAKDEGQGTRDAGLEYDFVVHPGADPKQIRLAVAPVSSPAVGGETPPLQKSANGDILIPTRAGDLRLGKPAVYQAPTDDGPRTTDVLNSQPSTHNSQMVHGRYVLTARNELRFALGEYDRTKTLVIDPTLAYSTYLGGSDYEIGQSIAVDSSGNAYVAGQTASTDFPTTSSARQTASGGGRDVFVTKLSADGSTLVYSTYLGGANNDFGFGIIVNSSGDAYVTGSTYSTDFPTTSGSFQSACASCAQGMSDGFVTKLSADGSSLLYSTYLGGSGYDGGAAISVDSSGNAYITGQAGSADFPTTSSALQTTCGGCTQGLPDAFAAKLNADGSSLIYSTYLGGSTNDFGQGISVDSSGNAYVTGFTDSINFPTTAGAVQTTCSSCSNGHYDAFVAKLNVDGSSLIYSTFLGGSDKDFGMGIAVDSTGNAHVAGQTYSADFPVTVGALKSTCGACTQGFSSGFVAKLSADGSALLYSTYLGGSGYDGALSIALDSSGNSYVTGQAISTDFPTTIGAIQTTNAGAAGTADAFVTIITPDGSSLVYSTCLGGSGNDYGYGIAVDPSGNAYVTGYTSSTDFPTTSGAVQATCSSCSNNSDAFVAKIGQPPPAFFNPGALSFAGQAVGTTSAAQTVVLNNASTASVNITAISASGDFAIDTSGTTCSTGTPVPVGGSCNVSVTFSPTTSGNRTGTLSITDDASNSPQTAALFGTGLNPAPGIAPLSLNFNNQGMNTTSQPLPLTLTNSSSTALSIVGIAVTGDFAQTNTCATSVAANGSCTINVTFTPTTAGTETGTLTITDNAVGSPQTVSLSGTGVPPSVTLSKTTLDFGSQPVSVASTAQTVTVTNNGPGPLLVTGVTIIGTNPGDFSQSGNCMGTITFPGSCTISITFTPHDGGLRSATISIADDAVQSPQTINVSGTGVLPTATQSATSLTFTGQKVGTTSAAQTVTINNTGSGPLSVSSVVISGTNAADFAESDNCKPTVAAAGNCTVNVTFSPKANGTRTASLAVSDNAAGGPQSVSLTGTGQAPLASYSTASVTFANATVGTPTSPISVTLTNTGGDALSVTNILVSASFAQTDNCPVPPATLAPSANCSINITFTAAAAGTTFGALIVSDNALGSAQQTVPLTGIATVGFGVELTGTTSTPKDVVLSNLSAASVTIVSVNASGDFELMSNPCTTLAPGGSCTLTVAFRPTGGGTRTGSLVIADTSPGSPHSVPLMGTGADFAVAPVAGSQSSATVSPGGGANYTISIAPQGGLATTVTLTCSGAPPLGACNVNPATVTLDGTNPATATVNVTTAAGSLVTPRAPVAPPSPGTRRVIPLAMFLFLLAGFLIRLRARIPSPESRAPALFPRFPVSRFLLPICLLLVLVSWPSCGGGGSSIIHNPGTPKGQYVLTITATTTGATTVTHTITLNLNVT